jgi:hypothetical protein
MKDEGHQLYLTIALKQHDSYTLTGDNTTVSEAYTISEIARYVT